MRKFSFVGCAYLLLFCMPLHLSAAIVGPSGLAETTVPEGMLRSVGDVPGELGEEEVSEAEVLELLGPGRDARRRMRDKKKRMKGRKKLLERFTETGIFGKKRKKDTGLGQNLLFLIVPAVAVVGVAYLFAVSTRTKNADSLLEPDPNGTN